MLSDEVCRQFADKNVRLTIKELDEETILIEGSRESLLFLGKFILAHAEDERDDGSSISPFGAGQAFFSKEATKGLYIYREGSHEAQLAKRR